MSDDRIASVAKIAGTVRSGDGSSRGTVEHFLARAQAADAALNCFIELDGEAAIHRATALDRKLGEGDDAGPLAGVPFAAKDIFTTGERRPSNGSRRVRLASGGRSSTALERLTAAGAIQARLAQPRPVLLRRNRHQPGLRQRAQPLGSDADDGRFLQRSGGGRCRRGGRIRGRRRHRRLGSDPGVVLRRRRPEADFRPDPAPGIGTDVLFPGLARPHRAVGRRCRARARGGGRTRPAGPKLVRRRRAVVFDAARRRGRGSARDPRRVRSLLRCRSRRRRGPGRDGGRGGTDGRARRRVGGARPATSDRVRPGRDRDHLGRGRGPARPDVPPATRGLCPGDGGAARQRAAVARRRPRERGALPGPGTARVQPRRAHGRRRGRLSRRPPARRRRSRTSRKTTGAAWSTARWIRCA